jgi:hypothetical protein
MRGMKGFVQESFTPFLRHAPSQKTVSEKDEDRGKLKLG